MKFLKVPIYLTFTNWLIIVVIGSLICPYVGEMVSDRAFIGGSSRQSADKAFEISLMCMVVSAVCSLPALIIMFVAHLLLNKNQVSKKRHMLIQNIVHIGVAILTFGVMYVLAVSGSSSNRDMDFIVILFLSYLPVGLIVWNIMYTFHKEKTPATAVAKGGDVLDEF